MPFVALLNKLMSSYDQSYIVCMWELIYNFLAKQPASSSRVLLPEIDVLLRIRPHQITYRPRWGNLNISFKSSNSVNCSSFGRKSAVYAKYLSFYDSGEWEVIKGVIKVMPDVVISIFFGYFVIKSIYIGYVTALMVAPQQYHSLRIF
mgnify:CR=1 FL=1